MFHPSLDLELPPGMYDFLTPKYNRKNKGNIASPNLLLSSLMKDL